MNASFKIYFIIKKYKKIRMLEAICLKLFNIFSKKIFLKDQSSQLIFITPNNFN